MRKASRKSVPEGTVLLFIDYVPNFENVGAVWFTGDMLLYDPNGFAQNNLQNVLWGWAERFGMKPDTEDFFNRLQLGDGWRWQMTTRVT